MKNEKTKRVSLDVAIAYHKRVQREAIDTGVKPKQYYEAVLAAHFKKAKE